MSAAAQPDPREAEIFLRSLRHYSESCEAPDLVADCPFSVDIAPGERGCGEECMDILAEHGAPPPVDEIKLSEGISVRMTRRPRARRPRRADTRPFDGREIYLDDKAAGPPPRWHLSSLLIRIEEALNTTPPGDVDRAQERVAEIEHLRVLIESRGLSFELDVLPYLRHSIVGAVVGSVVIAGMNPDGSIPTGIEGWSRFMPTVDPNETPGPERIGKLISEAIPPVVTWSATARFDELRDWTPPPPTLLEEDVPVRPPPEPDERGRWVVERFMHTYLENWATSSLHLEWAYIHGQEPSPCIPVEMSVRSVPEDDLAKIIADRAVEDRPPPQRLTASLVEPALRFLKQRRHVEAAGLFEAATRVEPNNADAHNNYGFCLLPSDPAGSLQALERFGHLRGGDAIVNALNRSLCLATLGRLTPAEDLARATMTDLEDVPRPPFSAWLWDPEELLLHGDAVLSSQDDAFEYLEALIRAVEAIRTETGHN